MRLYHLLIATAAALLASTGDFAGAATCRYKPSAPSTSTITEAPGISPTSSLSFDNSTPSTPDADASAADADQQPDTPANPATQPPTDASATTDSASTTGSSATTSTTEDISSQSSSSAATTPSTATNSSSATSSDNSKLCAKPRVRITEVDLGVTVDANEDEVNLKVVAIASLPSGGSRIAFHSGDNVIVRELDENDKLVSSSEAVKVPLHDFADIYADKEGFVLLGTRDAEGGGTLNCGNPSNLCGSAPNPAVPCYDMYLVRYDGSKETWATKLTSSSASLPPYSSSASGADVYMIWWYAHHGRIASDGTNWAAYFGCAISTSEGGCINIHQGDRMKVVDPSGKIATQADSFDWGCSHSGYERVTYDSRKKGYASICKTDSNNRIMPPNDWSTTIYPVDLAAANLGDIVPDSDSSSKKYWATVSNGEGDNAKVHLIHFAINAAADDDITLGGTDANERAPHLAAIGDGGLLAMWEGSSSGGDLTEGGSRTIYAQVLDAATGKSVSSKVTVDKSVVGNRYQALKSFPDGSVAYLSKGTTDTSVQVVRFFGC
ncbi:Avr1b-1 Avirulence-like protein [Phytophthora palmivora]|uniref:Avr1b-1 Avirulence-like protein n=1 Tax=Phytophthora palmivora TaxID=4796 RepID=A0A2P4XW64_9STRA|nr:Avr1b-1 Avirulence-like protein [Phytophthora palmivora]